MWCSDSSECQGAEAPLGVAAKRLRQKRRRHHHARRSGAERTSAEAVVPASPTHSLSDRLKELMEEHSALKQEEQYDEDFDAESPDPVQEVSTHDAAEHYTEWFSSGYESVEMEGSQLPPQHPLHRKADRHSVPAIEADPKSGRCEGEVVGASLIPVLPSSPPPLALPHIRASISRTARQSPSCGPSISTERSNGSLPRLSAQYTHAASKRSPGAPVASVQSPQLPTLTPRPPPLPNNAQ